VRGDEPPAEVTAGSEAKFKTAVDALALSLSQMKRLGSIDVVHTHTWYASMAGFLAKKLYGIPFVLTTHSLERCAVEGGATGVGLRDELVDGAHGDSGCGRDHRGVAWDEGGHSARVPEVDAAKVHVIYNGIDLREYRKTSATDALRKYGVDASRPYSCLWADHAAEGRDAPCGRGEVSAERDAGGAVCGRRTLRRSRRRCARAWRRRGAGANIVWIEKMVTKAEAIELYSNCRVFCCPSVYEPFGIINLEAMACGAPVVASATAGFWRW